MKNIFTIFLLSCVFSCQAQVWSWNPTKQGSHSVGHRLIQSINHGRVYRTSPIEPRVLPIHIWYPAERGGTKLFFGDYVKSDHNAGWEKNEQPSRYLSSWIESYVDSIKIREITTGIETMPTNAYQNARVKKGKFPVIVFGNGLTTPGFFYSLMAEFLASHGYVVVCYPSLSENASVPLAFTNRGVLNQLGDMEQVVDEVAKLPFVDMTKLALVAWSVGGATHVLFQMKHQLAKVMVSMDAASQYAYGEQLIKESVFYDSASFTTPFLNLTAAGPTRFNVPRSTFFYDSLLTNKRLYTFPKLTHSDFLSFKQLIGTVDPSVQTSRNSFLKMVEITKLFLDAKLQNRLEANEKLESFTSIIED